MTHSSSSTTSYQPFQFLTTSTQAQQSNNCFNRAHQVSLRSLGACDYGERKSVTKALADDTLAKAKPWESRANWRQFALMHCPGMILETSLEGGSETISAQSSLDFVDSCLSGEGLFFATEGVKYDTYRKLQSALSEYIELVYLRPPLTDDQTSKAALEQSADEWLEKIKNSSSCKDGVYLPLGYRHGTSNQAHAIACKIIDDPQDDVVLLHLFNLGNGSEPHPVLDYTLDQKKTSFSFPPIGIKRDLFYGEVGKAAFCYLLRYWADAPSKDHLHYDGKDVYDVFFQFLQFFDAGEIYPLAYQNEYAADLQKSGNCSEVAIRCIMEDVLIRAGISKEEREKVFLNREFCSLMAHYHAFIKNPSCHPSARDLLLDGARSFGANVKRLYEKKQISEQELIAATSTVHEIVKVTRKTPQGYSSHAPQPATHQKLFDLVDPATPHSARGYDSEFEFREIKLSPPRFRSTKTLVGDIQGWIKSARTLPEYLVFDYVSDCIRALPIPVTRDPKAKADPYNELPEIDAPDVLEGLKELMSIALTQKDDHSGLGGRYEHEFREQFLLVYAVYSIADKLARLSEKNKLDGYSCPFLPYPYQYEPYGFTAMPLREDNERYTQIFEYMTGKKYRSDKGYHDKVIFPVAPILNVGEFVHDNLSGRYSIETWQGKNHVEYLAKFLPPSSSATETFLSSYVTQNWMSALPPVVQHLYYFSFVSNLLFTANGMPLPKLVFTKTTEGGKDALQIKAPYFCELFTLRSFFGPDLKPKTDEPIRITEFEWREDSKSCYAFDLNNKDARKLTTNEAISYLLSEQERTSWALDEPALRTLLYDTRNDNLSLWQALQDFSGIENHYLLEHPAVQNALSACFFRPRFLLERMKAEPEGLTKAFRAFTTNGLKNYNDNPKHLGGILFLIRTGICFESYTTKGAQREEALEFYRKILLKLLKEESLKAEEIADIEYHLLFLETQSDLTNPEDLFVRIFDLKLKYTIQSVKEWLRMIVIPFRRQAAYKYASYFEDETKRNALCKRIISTIIKDPDILAESLSSKWEGSFPEFSCGDLSIDFLHTEIKSKKRKAWVGAYFLHRLDEAGIPPMCGKLVWINPNMAITFDGKLKWSHKTDEWTQIMPDTNGQLREAPIVRFRGGSHHDLDQDFLGDPNIDIPYLSLIHYKQADGSIISHDMDTNKPYLLREPAGNSVVYSRLSDDGKKLPWTMANLSKVDRYHPLYPNTVRYLLPSDIMCFVDEKTQKIQEINFYKLKIQFLNDGKGLSWKQNPDFYLISSENDLTTSEEKKAYADLLQEINSYEGAMILYNPKTKKWDVLFPLLDFSKVAQYGDDFSRHIRPSNKTKFPRRYFHFSFDPIEKKLKTLNLSHDQGCAYLAVLFKMQRSYEKAFFYLNQVKTSSFFSNDLISIFGKFFEIKDTTQASLAFNLKLCLYLIRNTNLMLEQQFQGNKHSMSMFNSASIDWAIKNYNLYLCDEASSKTPEALRLSEEEKKKLVLSFRTHYEGKPRHSLQNWNWEERWKKEQPILDAQYNVYFSAQNQNQLIPEPQEISIVPPAFSFMTKHEHKVTNDSSYVHDVIAAYESYHSTYVKREEDLEIADYPIRTTEQTIAVYLPQLYEEARKCLPGVICPFDFKLHALLKANAKGGRMDTALGSSLFWVRHFSDLFADCPLNSPPTAEELFKIFSRIREIPNIVPQRYEKIQDKLKMKQMFKIDHPIPLSAKKEKVKNKKITVAKTEPIPTDLSTTISETEKQIRQLFNSPYKVKKGVLSLNELEQEMCFRLSKDSAQILSFPKNGAFNMKGEGECLTETIMKQVILKNNLNYLYKHRPMLRKDEMNKLCRLTNEWYHARVLQKLKEEGKEHLYLPYDYQKYPEISYFYLKTGKFPRKTQLEVYRWIMGNLEKGIKVHYQLGAGDGKTDYLTPLLNLGAKRLWLLPVNCVTQSIYPVDKENLSYNLRSLGEDLYYLEVGIHMINQLSALDLQFIYAQLMQYKGEGKSMLLTRHTVDALRLICGLSLKNALCATTDAERKEIGLKIRYSMHILKFFKKSCLLLCDESHQNLDAVTRAIFGVGDLIEIPENESKHMLAMMKPLLAKFPKSPTAEEIDSLRKSLAEKYLELIPDLPKTCYEEVLNFWTDTKAPQPSILKTTSEKKETKEIANLISVTSRFLHHILPELLTNRTNVDHARSLYPQRKYEVPARNELPSTSEYDDKYKTCAMTIKGNYERGLSEDDIRFLLTEMLKKSNVEKTQGFHPEKTPSNLLFKEWMEKSSLKESLHKLDDILFNSQAMMTSLHETLGKKTEVIDHFLTKHAFVGIGSPTEELSSTTTDVHNDFCGSVSFSATPREDLSYPRSIKAYYKDLEFEKKVKDKWNESQNSTIVGAENEKDFFEQMNNGKYRQETVLIDPRGFFTSPSKKVAEKWLENNPKLEGVLYFRQARSTDVNRDEKICLLQRSGKVLELCGSDIELALKAHDLEWEKLNLGTLYGPAQTESANIKQKMGAKACYFLGDRLTTAHAIQAIMRCRGFRDLNQTVTTFVSQALSRSIFKEKSPTIEGLFTWTDENQKIEEEKRIILNAFQEIHYTIAEEAWARMETAHATDTSAAMDAVLAIYKQHAKGFVECNPTEAFQVSGEHEKMEKARIVLEPYAEKTYEKFAYETDYSTVKDAINEIITAVEKRIAEIASGYEKQSSKEIEQHLELKAHAQREQQKAVPRPADPLSLEGEYGNCRITTPEYLKANRTLANEIFGTKFLSENLYFGHNHTRTAKLRDDSDPSTQFLKPIQFFTITITPDKVFAEAESNDINAAFQDDLLSCPATVKDLKHTAFFTTATGFRIQKGTGALTPKEDILKAIMARSWFYDLTVDAALLKGVIENPDALIPRIKKTGWKEFETLWNKIIKGLPNPERAQTQAFGSLKERYMKENGRDAINS